MTETIDLREGLFRRTPGEGVLLGSRCKKCGQICFPFGSLCLACRSNELEEIELSSEGELFCETQVHMETPRFAASYHVGYVALREGIRVFSQLRAVEGKPFKVGVKMKLELVPLFQEDGKDVIAHRFYPA